MKTSLIVAMDRQRGIGKNNDLLWHLPADMKFFRETTSGHIVVMGRKNFESIPEKFRPLPNRENVVLTRNKDFKADDVKVFHSMEECLMHYQNETERKVFIIGGGEIYRKAMDLGVIGEMFISHVDETFESDTFFPEFDESKWTAEKVLQQEKDEKNKYAFAVMRYERK